MFFLDEIFIVSNKTKISSVPGLNLESFSVNAWQKKVGSIYTKLR
jgi:hypothetical protein